MKNKKVEILITLMEESGIIHLREGMKEGHAITCDRGGSVIAVEVDRERVPELVREIEDLANKDARSDYFLTFLDIYRAYAQDYMMVFGDADARFSDKAHHFREGLNSWLSTYISATPARDAIIRANNELYIPTMEVVEQHMPAQAAVRGPREELASIAATAAAARATLRHTEGKRAASIAASSTDVAATASSPARPAARPLPKPPVSAVGKLSAKQAARSSSVGKEPKGRM
jgi:hypothetical protein